MSVVSDETRRRVCDLVINRGLTPVAVARQLGVSTLTVRHALWHSVELGETERPSPGEYRWAAKTDKPKTRLPLVDQMLSRGECPICGARRKDKPNDWLQINGRWTHYTEACLRRRINQLERGV